MQFFAEGEKTEDATPRRQQEARKKGQVVKSSEVNSAVNLLVLTLLFVGTGHLIFSYLTSMLIRCLQLDTTSLTPGNFTNLIMTSLTDFFIVAFPILLAAVIAGLLVNYMQVGFLFTTEPLSPQFNRLNPLEGFKKIFSKRALFELLKALLKIAVVAFVAFIYVRSNIDTFFVILYQETAYIWDTISSLFLGLAVRIGAAFLVLALADYLYQRYEHQQNLKMSKQEVKEEFKQTEGDPQLKGRLRERRRQLSMHRMMESIPEATVVITNPTHLAIALRYREGVDDAPLVVAKGAELMAKRIRETAEKHKIPIIENKPVARMLFEQVEIGQAIPVQMYQAVAEILALVYKLR